MAALGVAALLVAAAPAGELSFRRDDGSTHRLAIDAIRRRCHEQVVSVHDPYYEATKRYRACPLAEVLRLGFGSPPPPDADVVFRALDGYAKPASGRRVVEEGGWIAFGDADRPSGFDVVGRGQVDPGPLYVVWSRPGQDDAHVYPWPYQLAEIELTDVTRRWPHVVPEGVSRDSAAWRGFTIFRGECIACHSVNGEGGTVGPDLNVPQSVVEYRPVEQIKAYIHDPSTFRYGKMPANPHLTPSDLDALVAYFDAMKTRKHDPRAGR